MPPESSSGNVLYESHDYAGGGTRWAIIAVDGALLLMAYLFLVAVGLIAIPSDSGTAIFIYGATYSLLWIFYLGFMHATPLGTIGYRVLGCKLVDYQGKRLSLWRSLVRCGSMAMAPAHLMIDGVYFYCGHTHQTIWDLTSETFVVRRDSQPAGRAGMKYKLTFVVGWAYVWREHDANP